LVEEIQSFGGEATAIVADVTVFEQVKAIADRTVEVYGRLDTWVHCPAIAVYATFDNTTPEEFKRVMMSDWSGRHTVQWRRYPISKVRGEGR
jgi:NAD(P)-dependent dehydrogenase (short-subunit alcohol dehydrogenase family)